MPATPVRVTFQLLGFDTKRLHYFEQLFHAQEGWLSATSENMALHVDMAAKKTAAFPDDIVARLARMRAAHAELPIRRRRAKNRHARNMPGKCWQIVCNHTSLTKPFFRA